MWIEIDYPLGYASLGDTLFRDTGDPSSCRRRSHLQTTDDYRRRANIFKQSFYRACGGQLEVLLWPSGQWNDHAGNEFKETQSRKVLRHD